MISYDSIQELADKAKKKGKMISELVLEDQALQMERSREELMEEMRKSLQVMAEAATKGLTAVSKSASGLSGGDANKMRQSVNAGQTLSGKVLSETLAKALAIAEVNACMGRIVAAPTAGSCGIIPAVLLTLKEENDLSENQVVMSLFTAAGLGMVIAKKASISGAEGGCQAECGSAAAMAAAAAVELMGGTPQMCANACAIALKSVLGLVCDPVAGLVEVPCVKRNASGAANALIAAEMALAGIESTIPVDEVIGAMKAIGDAMPKSLKETAEGGLADTPTGKKIARDILR
ncbi:L-serine ammonia-lyase, iron-sulfur-dependent, subunit alpha [Acetobacterium sp.]|jgi:L-serine dehydratase|uniref:L-serine ammonia-lyase, iron-sulfur-dependent, subunit alpha n=1 Tax=Acetobacterium sp. TaxID=1872094 RepID=UPI0027209159|nr:L-serine ammonia-lyase, iron-sulfur-dependent, subunit alpha [Acetobacterium sp.]MDO9490728.1 L-serine ammonia-lyase, iron-sulfur-dependent, subunit alpha [Acetobacterium sp.]